MHLRHWKVSLEVLSALSEGLHYIHFWSLVIKISQEMCVLTFHPRMSGKWVTNLNHRTKSDSILGPLSIRNMGYAWQFRVESE